jgi:hypothetical protein
MRKALLPILSLTCLTWLCLNVQAQQSNGRSQSPVLPPPVAVDAKQVEQATSVAPANRMNRPCYGDPIIGANPSYQVVKQEPQVGIKIKDYPSPMRGGGTSRAEDVRIHYRVIFQDVKYDVMADGNGIIKSIGTDDESFLTPEGLRIWDGVEKVLKASEGNPVSKSLCSYDYKLKSGWHAVIGIQYILDDGSLTEDAKVTFFYKRD